MILLENVCKAYDGDRYAEITEPESDIMTRKEMISPGAKR